jgi:ABC-type glycerol-3-phosphate transport system substrate-binding protein
MGPAASNPPHAQSTPPWAITRRAAIGSIVVGAAGFAALGPRGEGDQARGDGRIVLDYWEKWTRHEGDAMVRIVNAFNESQSRIRVRYIVVSDIGQKSLVSIAGGRPPDIIGLYAFNVPPYAESGAIIPLDDLAKASGMRLDQYATGVRRVMTHNVRRSGERWWAVVNTAGSIALYYNRAAFREANLDPDRPPTTIAEFDAAHKKLIKTDAKGNLQRLGFLHREPGWWSWLWAYHFGGRIYDEATNRALVDSAENIRAMRWMSGYIRDLGVERVRTFADSFGHYFTPENPFLTGKLATVIQGPWMANLINAFKPDLDYGVVPFPTESAPDPAAPVGLIDTDVMVIPRGCRHPEAAMEFIAFTQQQHWTEQLATAHCKPSPLATVSPEFLKNHPNRGITIHYNLLKSPRAYVPPRTRVWQQFKDEFDTTVIRMRELQTPVEQALGSLQARAQSLLDQSAREEARRYGTGGGA